VELSDRAETIFREQCAGILVAWHIDTAQMYSLLGLTYLGDVRELSRRVPSVLAHAESRDNIVVKTSLMTRISYLVDLSADQPQKAREQVLQGIDRWTSQAGLHLQHVWGLVALGWVDLYEGKAEAAWNRMRERWPLLRRSLQLRTVQSTLLRLLYARSAMAVAAARSGRAGAPLLAVARRDASRIEREGTPWGDALARMVRAGANAAEGRTEPAASDFAVAEAGLVAADMGLHAAAARLRRGELIGGDEGRELVRSATTWMTTQGIRDPARMASAMAPVGAAR
jgi:hypothetical protein